MKSRKKSYKIKSKFRFTTSIIVTIMLIVFMTSNILGLNDVSSLTKNKTVEVEIQSGDTLWMLASKYGPDNTDPREIIHEICRLNDISAESIYPGQIILIPDYI